ncbi:Ig-like domain-containing protein [Lactiplantibacillus plajomi]|uniref:Ig-like domain-containing protein n=1 Tax=Lactiplantibacillus plajomi TaxID=1457217 RepID=A0ABV6K558_9LACO|nr:Ig-like domain-containing protein [Lactiplantibacillus plajomi]
MKKIMIALTSLVAVTTLGTTVTVPTNGVVTAQAATKKVKSPKLSVKALYSGTKQVKGTATKGSKITVKATKNAKKTLGKATASKTGKYTVKLKKTLKTSQRVYVYATNPKTKAYYYEIIHVQAAKQVATKKQRVTTKTKATTKKKAVTKKKAATKTTKKATTKKAAAKTTEKATKATTKKKAATKSFDIKAPAGTWKSNKDKQYQQVWSFSTKKGFNQKLYKNGKKVKTLVAYANYQAHATKTANVWKLTYQAKGQKRHTVYMRYTSAKRFKLVNAKNKVVKTKAGVAPATSWTFTK